jgi:Predicted membrane protein
MKTLKRFLIYGIIGLVLEIIYTGVASLLNGDFSMRGMTFLVMLPIYGLSVFLEPVHHYLRPSYPWWLRGLIYLALIWGIEYSSGVILAMILGSCPWHYTDPLNVNGYITFRMAPEWFLAGLGFEFLHDYLDTLPMNI